MRTISSAACDACSRTISRSPGNRATRSFTPLVLASARCTNPTGFSSLPPPGPAIPVIPTPSVLPRAAGFLPPAQSPLPRSPRLSLQLIPSARPPTLSSFHCCSKPLHPKSMSSYPQCSSIAPQASLPCSSPPPQSLRCSLSACLRQLPAASSHRAKKSCPSKQFQILARFPQTSSSQAWHLLSTS